MAHPTVTQPTASEKAVDQYFEAWNARDLNVRAAALQGACTADVKYTDPKADVKGQQALNGMMEAVQTQVSSQHATFSFLRTSAVDEHHGCLRFDWALQDHNGAVFLAGVDFGQIDDAGRLRVIVGFVGERPAAL